jgi:hypothetical protein
MNNLYLSFSPNASDINEYIAVISNNDGSMTVDPIMKASLFKDKLFNLQNKDDLLKLVIKNLWDTHKYNQEYISFLLGAYSEDEFLSIAEKYVEEPLKTFSKKEISFALNFLSSVLGNDELTSSDLSILLNQDCSDIESTLTHMDHPRVD